MKKMLMIVALLSTVLLACKKDKDEDRGDDGLRYFEVGRTYPSAVWQDTSFIVATRDPVLIAEIETQLNLPVRSRRIVNGALVPGDGGYNRNATHSFQWHFKEDDWKLIDMVVEIYDGLPYTDVDKNNDYWMNTMKRFSPWSSYIKREIKR